MQVDLLFLIMLVQWKKKTSEQFVLKELEKITPNLSPEAKRYLDRLVVGQVIGDL